MCVWCVGVLIQNFGTLCWIFAVFLFLAVFQKLVYHWLNEFVPLFADLVLTLSVFLLCLFAPRQRSLLMNKIKSVQNILKPQHMVVFFLLFISILQNPCSGAFANEFLSMEIALTLSHMNIGPPTIVRTQTCLSASPPTHLQRSRRDLECSSKVPSISASNCRQKANVSMARTDQSGRGTYRVSPTWAACSLVRNSSTATSRSGMCRGWRICAVCSLVRHRSMGISRNGMCQV